jgi:hypothetical protein
MIQFQESRDSKGGHKKILIAFDKVLYNRGEVDIGSITDTTGFQLRWTYLALIRGINSDGLPNIKTIPLGQLIVGKEGSHEEEITRAKRWTPQMGVMYEIREYTRVTYFKRLYKWFGMVLHKKHVYKVIGEGCPDYTFSERVWADRTPTDFEIINSAKDLYQLSVRMFGEEHEQERE